jgi:FHS family glucose/mannose:H+ symporter-like MFS transporter
MFFLGLAVTIIGAAARNIGLLPHQIGLLMAIQNVGFFLAVILSGALADTHEKPRLLFVGSLVLAVSYFFFYMHPSFLLNILIMFFIGAGIGVYEGVLDAMLMDIHKKNESLYININHLFVTLGSLSITVYLIFLQMNWRKSVIQASIAVFLVALFYLFARLKIEKTGVESFKERMGFLRKQKIIGLLFIVTICAVGYELGNIGILTTFLMQLRGFDQITSKIALVLFISGAAVGRILVGVFVKNEKIFKIILLLFGMSAIVISCVYFIKAGFFTYILVFFSGMTVSALVPLLITLTGLTYKDISGTAMGVIKLAMPIGGILIPFINSMLAKYISFRASLFLFPVIMALSFLILVVNRNEFKFGNS